MLKLLKVEVKTSASKAKFLRLEEHKSLVSGRFFKEVHVREDQEDQFRERSESYYNTYQNLRHQRTHFLRKKSRSLQLAYGFLKGKPYNLLEEKEFVKNPPNFKEVEQIVFQYSWDDPREVKQSFEQWLQEAQDIEKEPVRKEA